MVDDGNCCQEKPTSREVSSITIAISNCIIIIMYDIIAVNLKIIIILITLIRFGKMPEMFPGRVGAVVQVASNLFSICFNCCAGNLLRDGLSGVQVDIFPFCCCCFLCVLCNEISGF